MNDKRQGAVASRIATIATLAGCLLVSGAGCRRHHAAMTQPAQARTGASDIEALPLPAPPPPRDTGERRGRPDARIAAQTLSRKLPAYPQAALADEVACAAEVLYHIQTDGTAKLVRLSWVEPPPPAHRDVFEQSIRSALATWEFIPAVKLSWQQGDDGKYGYVESRVPKARNIRITFRVENGTAVVR